MNAGLPGTGIGGLFYIASALWMPAHRALTGPTHEGKDWRRVTGQVGIAGGVLASLFATGWLLGLMLAPDATTAVAATAGGDAARAAYNMIRWITVIGTAGLLVGVLLLVEGLNLVLQVRGRGDQPSEPAPRPRNQRALHRVA